MATPWTKRSASVTNWFKGRDSIGTARVTEDNSQRVTEDGLLNRILDFINWIKRIIP